MEPVNGKSACAGLPHMYSTAGSGVGGRVYMVSLRRRGLTPGTVASVSLEVREEHA